MAAVAARAQQDHSRRAERGGGHYGHDGHRVSRGGTRTSDSSSQTDGSAMGSCSGGNVPSRHLADVSRSLPAWLFAGIVFALGGGNERGVPSYGHAIAVTGRSGNGGAIA